MSVWLCMPSKRPPEEVEPILKLWREQGYKIALFRDEMGDAKEYERYWRPGHALTDLFYHPHPPGPPFEGVLGMWPYAGYPGYAQTVNELIRQVIRLHFGIDTPDWFVCAGDDTEPDANHTAEEIAKQCTEHFNGTFGVLQCTGDKWGSNNRKDAHTFTARAIEPMHLCSSCGHPKDNARHMVGSYIDRVAGSPWMGREWCSRANQGKGPLWPEFTHMFGDQCLRDVAVMLGVYWERPDLVHLHKHWGRVSGEQEIAGVERMPEFLKRWNTTEHWNESKAIYERLKANGFKECLPL